MQEKPSIPHRGRLFLCLDAGMRSMKMAEHGTRTMYVHYGCRCEACRRAEHEQYLKRPEAKKRKRYMSKSSGEHKTDKAVRKHDYYCHRRDAIKSRPHEHTKPINWKEIAESHGLKCEICGIECDPSDTWINDKGRRCYGRLYPTVDHIVPLKHGGTDTFGNVQIACKRCNSKKGARLEVAV